MVCIKDYLPATSATAKAITVSQELHLKDGREDLNDRLLKCPVNYRRDTEFAHTAIRFGYLYPPHWCRFAAPRKNWLSDTRPISVHVVAQVFDFNAVYACRAIVGYDPCKGCTDVVIVEYLFD